MTLLLEGRSPRDGFSRMTVRDMLLRVNERREGDQGVRIRIRYRTATVTQGRVEENDCLSCC